MPMAGRTFLVSGYEEVGTPPFVWKPDIGLGWTEYPDRRPAEGHRHVQHTAVVRHNAVAGPEHAGEGPEGQWREYRDTAPRMHGDLTNDPFLARSRHEENLHPGSFHESFDHAPE